MLQRLADLPRLLQLWALQHDGESHHFAPSMLALCLKIWNTQHAIHWNLLFTISSSSFSPSHSGDLQPSDRHGSKVLGPVVHLPDWGFKIPFFQEILEKHFPRFYFFQKSLFSLSQVEEGLDKVMVSIRNLKEFKTCFQVCRKWLVIAGCRVQDTDALTTYNC